MSDTSDAQPAAAAVPAPEVNISEPRNQVINSVTYPVRSVQYGTPPTVIEVRELDEADQWDIAELAGAQLSENMPWMTRTMVAMSVISIAGVPLPAAKTREDYRNRLRRLGREGVAAAMAGLAASIQGAGDGAATLDTAKN